MVNITDSIGTWEELGVISPSNQWNIFDNPIINSETLRLTTTILNQEDWNNLKIRSGAYIQFYYSNSNASEKYWVGVNPDYPIIKEFKLPQEMKEKGQIIRYVGCILSNSKINQYSLQSYARWNLKIECLL